MGKIVKGVFRVALIAVGTLIGGPLGGAIGAAIGGIASKALFKPKSAPVNRANQGRLFASIDPHTSRKVVFGRTAMGTDVIYQGYTGTDQEYYHLIIAVAAHKASAIEEVWFDDKQAWASSGGVTGDYSGYLTVATVLEGNSGNMIDIDAKWGSGTNRRLTGCAYVHLRFKLTGNSKKSESPFSTSIPTRMTIIGKGLPVYDPRLDSTRGGSGSHRAEDQTTWTWTDNLARNTALCELTWLIGWRIGGKVSVGRGVPLARIDFASFITAANACDEPVTLAAGGTEPRYRFDGVFGEDEEGSSTRGIIETSMNGELRDLGGKLGLQVFVNDIASPVISFTTDDFVGPFEWLPVESLDADRNIGRGRYTDARTSSLYQLAPFPEVASTSPDGIDRILTRDYPGVQSVSQAQRLMKQELQRLRVAGVFTTTVNAKGWAVRAGDPVRVTHSELGFVSKPFRVREAGIDPTGRVPMVLTEEDAALYAWAAEDGPAITLGGVVVYDPLNAPLVQQLETIETGATATATADSNRVPLSRFEAGTTGWGVIFNPSARTFALAAVDYLGERALALTAVNFSAAAQTISIGSVPTAAFGTIKVTPGERVFAGVSFESTGPIDKVDGSVTWLDASGAGIGSPFFFGTKTGATAAYWALGGFTTVPTNAVSALFEIYLVASGAGTGTLRIAKPIVASASATQTVWPAFVPGPGAEKGADVTANNDPRIVVNLTWELQANSAGTIQTALPATRRASTFRGVTDVSTTSAVSITTTGGVAATIDNTSGGADRGVITLGTGTTSGGTIVLTSTLLTGAVVKEVINVVVNKAVDVPGGTGGAGSGSATGSLAGVTFNSTTFVAIGQEIQVQSDGAGKVKISLNALYSATNAVTGQFRVAYATTSGGSRTALGGTDVTGTAFIVGEGDASADLAEVEVTMPAATTNYFFRAEARRQSGSGKVTPTGSIMVRKP